MAGDFNVVRFPSECTGTAAFSAAMMQFSDFISDLDLVDIPLLGGRFTWSNSSENIYGSRIDSFLFSADWDDQFPTISQKRLPRILLDHFPILKKCLNKTFHHLSSSKRDWDVYNVCLFLYHPFLFFIFVYIFNCH